MTIGNSVTSIGDWAFEDCSSLTSIEVGKGNIEYSSEDGVLFDKSKTELIQFPAGKNGHYTIPDNVSSIGDTAFYDCSSLRNITFEGNAPLIGTGAFFGVSEDAKIIVYAGATGFGETFEGSPVIIQKKLEINTFSQSASPSP